MDKLLKFVLLCMVISMVAGLRDRQRGGRDFGDYLVSVVSKSSKAHNQVLKPGSASSTTPVPPESPADQADSDEDEEDDEDETPEIVEDTDILGYFRDVPRRHWSCCMLGILAGEKGFHCHVQFYAAQIARNNRNRAHSRKMMFHGRDAVQNWGRDIMTTFSRCINAEEGEFHRCCRTATDEQRERRRWQAYRHVPEGGQH